MESWIWEVVCIAPAAVFGGRILERLLDRIAPRLWWERFLPPSNSANSFTLALEYILYAALVAVGVGVIGGVMGTQVTWQRALIALLPLIGVSTACFALANLHLWWILEPGCPLRTELDRLADKTGITLKRVRLRESEKLLPRIFPDGSIELTTAFFAELSHEEQEFLLALTLDQYRSAALQKRLLLWVGITTAYIIAIALETTLRHWFAPKLDSILSSFLVCNGVLVIAIYRKLKEPRFSRQELQFALQHTGNWEAAERVIQRMDTSDAQRRLRELGFWWKNQQAQAAIATVSTQATMTSAVQQSVGRKP